MIILWKWRQIVKKRTEKYILLINMGNYIQKAHESMNEEYVDQ